MSTKPTMYEILGVPRNAGPAELHSGYRRAFAALDAAKPGLDPQVFADRMQVLRLALNTLADPASRVGYDAKLGNTPSHALVPRYSDGSDANGNSSAGVRADALSLRADALALRADAMLLRSGLDAPPNPAMPVVRTIATKALAGLKYFARAVGLLVLTIIVAFALTRCVMGGSSGSKAAAKAQEKVALQEYFQTHGVRPANMAELELLEAERQRRENEQRAQNQNGEQARRDARQFEEESRQRGREATEALQAAEDQAERQRQYDAQTAVISQQAERERAEARRQAEERRLEREQQQWREVLKR